MIAIVMGHPMHTSLALGELLYSFHVPLFFILSGALLRPEKYQSLRDYLVHQVKKILLPYFALYTCNIAFWYTNWKVIAQASSSTKMVMAGVYTANQTIIPMSNGALWFLPVLFLTAVVGFGFARRMKRKSLGTMALLSLVLGFVLIELAPDPLPWTINVVPVTTFFYLCGYLLMPYGVRLSEHIKNVSGIRRTYLMGGGITILVIGFFLGWRSFEISNEFLSLMRLALGSIPLGILAALIISIGFAIVLIAAPRFAALEWYGRTTMGTLALHVPIMRMIENVCTRLSVVIDPVLIGLITVMAVIPINTLIYKKMPWIVGL